MVKTVLKSSTAAVLGLSLAVPQPILAQSESTAELPPCVDAKGELWLDLPLVKANKAGKKAKDPKPLKDGEEMANCVIMIGADDFVFSGVKTETGEVVLRKRELVDAMIEMGLTGAQATATTEAGAEAVADAAEAAEAVETLTEQAEGASTEPAEPVAEAAPEPVEEAPVEEAPVAEAPAEPAAEAEENLAEALEQAAENADDEAAVAAEAEAAAETPVVVETETDTAVVVETDTNDPDTAMDNGDVSEPIVDGAKTVVVDETDVEVVQDDTSASTEAANTTVEAEAAAQADGDAAAVEGEVEVETQTVTEAETRRSDEDFATDAISQAGEKQGLSDFEKFAIGAIGAAAVGAILSDGKKVVSNSGDRVVVLREDGQYEVLKDDNVLLRRPGAEIKTERFSDGSTRETITRRNGVKVVTIKAPNGQVLRRVRVMPDGETIVLFDDTAKVAPVVITELPEPRRQTIAVDDISADELRLALAQQDADRFDRRFTLQQIRQIRAVRELVPVIELEAVNFDTGSAAIRASEAEELRNLGVAMQRLIEQNPYEVFLVEGHTDAVGSATYNLALSDRRAESVALALTEYFDVPPENMVVQGYGEANLKIRTPLAERENRRATVRRITPLLQVASSQ